MSSTSVWLASERARASEMTSILQVSGPTACGGVTALTDGSAPRVAA